MALRRVLGSSCKYIQNYGRLIGSHGRSVSTPTNTKKQEFDYHKDLGGLGPARFATQEFNRLKNAQLQISRVLKASCRHMRKELWRSPGYYYQRYYELVLEAVDADEVKFYQARVAVDSVDDRMWLKVFCVMDEHHSLRLYHHLDNFFDEDASNSRGPDLFVYPCQQIHSLIVSLGITSIEIQTINPSDTRDGGILVMVKGFVKTRESSGRRKFVQTFMAPLEQQVQHDFETAVVVEETPAEKTFFVSKCVNDVQDALDRDLTAHAKRIKNSYNTCKNDKVIVV